MIVTLIIIGAVCGGIIAWGDGLTAPIIEERERLAFLEALENFYPALDVFEDVNINGRAYYVISDASGNLLGVLGKGKASGYGGPILFDLAADTAGDIIGFRISKQTETPGIGDVIYNEEFYGQFMGKNYADPIAIGVDVDTISGATVTTKPVLEDIRKIMDEIGEYLKNN
jgi:electron transport complex protein RnfG